MSALYTGLAEILEVEETLIGSDFDLTGHNWDSLAVVSTIALIDECEHKMVDGSALAACTRVGEIEDLIARTAR